MVAELPPAVLELAGFQEGVITRAQAAGLGLTDGAQRYVRIGRAHGLPRASRQARLRRGGRTIYRDNLYQEYAVAVELDGRAAHPAESRWRDMRRDNAGLADGVVTLRYGYADVTERPCQIAAEVSQVLRSRGWAGRPHRCGPRCASGHANASGRERPPLRDVGGFRSS
jgi:very-short-patch-repair endonuclease